MATALPRLTRINYNRREKFIADLNMLTRTAHAHALITGKPVQLFFDLSFPKKIMIRVPSQRSTDAQHARGSETFEPLTSEYGNNELVWDDHFDIQQFVIDGKDEAVGANLKTIWFYISPDGLAQQVTLVLKEHEGETVRTLTLEMNPFFVQFVAV